VHRPLPCTAAPLHVAPSRAPQRHSLDRGHRPLGPCVVLSPAPSYVVTPLHIVPLHAHHSSPSRRRCELSRKSDREPGRGYCREPSCLPLRLELEGRGREGWPAGEDEDVSRGSTGGESGTMGLRRERTRRGRRAVARERVRQAAGTGALCL
jgi:hypothetical protein